MTISTLNIFEIIDITNSNLTVGDPNGTLAKIKYVGNLKLSDKIVLFDVLVVPKYCVSLLSMNKLIRYSKMFVGFTEPKCFIQDLHQNKIVGTGSESGGLYMFDYVSPLSSNSQTIGNLFVVYFVSKSTWHTRLGHPSDQAVDMLHPNDDGRVYDTPRNDGNAYPCSSNADECEDDFATSMGETSSSKGNVHINSDSPAQRNLPENLSQGQPDLRRSSRVPKMPAKFNDYVVNSSKKYGLEKYVTYTNLNTSNYRFSTNLNKSSEPTSYFEAVKNPNWIEAMNNEIEALNRNNTWTVCDLPMGRKARDGFDYLDTFSPVVKMSTVRCMLNVAICNGWDLFQVDINNAFLYGDLSKDVYMTLPLSFDTDKSKVCKLNKSLYGLKQAPRQWNAKLTQALTEHGFVQSKFDYSLFTKNSDNVFIILLVYVDDIVVTRNNLNEIKKFKQFLKSKFQIKDLGKLKYFLGIEVLDNKDGICLSQRKYCLELLHEFGLLAAKHVDTPLLENATLNHTESDDDHLLVNVSNYQRLVGKLIYLTNTRPDIAYVVHCLSQYMHSPLNSHLDAALRVLRYLKGSQGSATRKSISRYCVFLGDSLITWKSKKQSTLFRSSAEAGYRSMASATCEVIWLSNLLGDMGVKNLLPVVMYCENSSALQIAANPVFHEKSKHFKIDVHLVVENVVENEPHFSLEVVDQDLSPLAMFIIHLMSEQGKRVVGSQWQKRWAGAFGIICQPLKVAKDGLGGDGFVVDGGRSPSTSSRDGEDGGVENKSSMGSRLIATGEGGEEVLGLTKQHGLTLILAVHFRLVLFSLGIVKKGKTQEVGVKKMAKNCALFIEKDGQE
ncbi:ribonuclease H-like domain-containing protein [Tanacetum coccineum]